MEKKSMFIEQSFTDHKSGDMNKNFDDDGRQKRTGTWMTGSAHIITAVIGSGVLSLAWAIAQLGWVAGPAVLMAFSFITYFTSTMLADCYRSPDPVTGKRNYTYMEVVRSYLEFPDEVDIDQPQENVLQKDRGLKSFRTSS